MNHKNLNIHDNIHDDLGSRNFRRFFHDFINKFVEKNIKYFEHTNDFVCSYTEKQLDTIIAPILDELSTVFLCEHPTSRKFSRVKDDQSHGWIDYWVKYGDSIFLIELKHSYNALNSKVLKDKSKKAWEKAVQQLKQIKKTNDFRIKNEKVIKIALMITTTHSAIEIQNNLETCQEIGILIRNELSLKSDKDSYIIANWVVDNKISTKRYEYKDGNEYYPYLHVLAYVVD